MRYVSVFSGIEAASCAWGRLGWEPVAFSEIEPFPCAVLDYRFPGVPNLGDITKVDWSEIGRAAGPVDLVAGGSPCQSFSVAGKREGLDGESRLMWEYVRCVSGLRPRWLVWENVPGALSSGGGDDFRCLLEALDALGYGMAWRVLDARFFGVAQRRERVWLVGHLGERPPVGVLFEPDGLRWDFEAGREKWQGLAAAAGIDLGVAGFKWHQGEGARSLGLEDGQSPTLVADYHQPGCLTPWDVQSKRVFPENAVADSSPCADRGPSVVCMADDTARESIDVEQSGTLKVGGPPPSVAVDVRNMRAEPELSGTLQAKPNGGQSLNYINPVAMKVRGGAETYVKRDGSIGTAGKGALFQEEQAFTVAATQDQTIFQQRRCQDVDAEKRRRAEALRGLWSEDAPEATQERRPGKQYGVPPEEILRQGMHGERVRFEAGEGKTVMDDRSLPRKEDMPGRLVRDVRKAREDRRASSEWELARQQSGEPDKGMPELPYERTSPEEKMLGMRGTPEGVGVLQQTLHEIQEIRRPTDDGVWAKAVGGKEGWGYVVRRLTPL